MTARIVVLGSALVGCACRHSPLSDERLQSAPNVGPSPPGVAPTRSPTAQAAPDRGVSAICKQFAETACRKLDRSQPVVAVLPIADADGRLTPCSDYLADELLAAFLSVSAQAVDRRSLEAVLTEIDVGAAFDRPQQVARIARADVLVVGRYALAAGELAMSVKAVDVSTNRLVHLVSDQVRAGRRVRQLAFVGIGGSEGGGAVQVREVEGGVRIRASYTEAGAGQFRLLDRVRQKVRRLHARYLRDAVGLDLSAEGIEERFRRGVEADCRFDGDSVTLEMEFGVGP
ncbi:MAG: hypothetical protein JSV19_12955 [Phycisphaerales bacterium]|nr:MAG: hypothetical protein JSV19_12955 [Phycisphaerales bacterium]